ncbi:MAG: peptidase C11, partial [Oscillospiraceae bacterium]|nr:peptidase C11 [Oscillospiraceae bacterium]
MENNRPKGREKDVTGPGKTVHKRGDGLGTGPVGDAGEYKDQQPSSGGARSGGTRAGGTRASGGAGKLIALVLAVLLGGGGGGLAAFLGSQSGTQTQTPPAGQQQQQQPNQGGSTDWTQLFSGLGGGSVSSGWENPANTGRLDTSVAKNAREKYTKLLGGGKDTATIMVYMCGTDLESRSGMGTADLQEMLNARFGDNLNLLVYTGGCKGWKNNVVSSSTNQVWQVKDGQLVKLRDNLGSVSMTDPSTLSDYIQWCAKDYPASRYELILWDHGGGSVSGYGYDEKFASTGSMNLAEVESALKAAGVKFDFIGF